MEVSEHSAIPLLVLTKQQDHVEFINKVLRQAGYAAHCHWVNELNDLAETVTQVNAHLLVAFVGADPTETAQLFQVQKHCAPKLPVLLVREQLDEEIMTAAMQAGARDVVTLNHPARLQLVAVRELQAFQLERSLSTTVSAAREYREQLKAFMSASADAIAHVQEGILIDANPTWSSLFGHAEADTLVGQPLMDLFDAETHAALKGALVACLQGKWRNHSLKAVGLVQGGSTLPLELQFQLMEIEGDPAVRVSVIAQRQDARGLSQQLQDALQRDATTGLLQRRCFLEHLRAALSHPVKAGVRELVCIEPDSFSAVAQTLGPSAVEDFVGQFAELIKESLQAETLAGRFGDATFLVLLERGTREDVEAWCGTLVRRVAGHLFAVADKSLSCTCSIGHGVAGSADKHLDPILADALQALAAAAQQGGGRVHANARLDEETRSQANDKIWVKHIRSALMENRFRLMQQPIASLLGGERAMFDVLVRMLDEQGQEVLPADFMAAAERNDLMKNIDRWVIGAAMSFCGSRPVQRLFVRLSKDSVLDRSLPQWLANQLKATRMDPARIAFQIDERVVAQHLGASMELTKLLRQAGFKFVLEHFGAGKDSVRLLKQMPVDYIKVDGTLMQSVAADHNVQELVRAIVDAAKSHKIATIAERIEDANTMAVLWQLGIEFIQGFFVNEPEQVTIG